MKVLKGLCLFAALICLVVVGCGPGYSVVPVSGKVTINGEPAAGLKIVFYPKGDDANKGIAGPHSTATTAEDGSYTLKTRYGDDGAVVGEHRVMIEMGDGDDGLDIESLDEAKSEMDEAKAEGDKASFGKAQKRYMRMKKKFDKLKNIPKEYLDGKVIAVTVPSGGTSGADFDLADD